MRNAISKSGSGFDKRSGNDISVLIELEGEVAEIILIGLTGIMIQILANKKTQIG